MTAEADRPIPGRLQREVRTIEIMIAMYCRGAGHPAVSAALGTPQKTRGETLCPECRRLLDYSVERVRACRFGEGKPACAHCPVHCFRKEMRESIRTVMRYSGPRMTLRHPYLALRHLADRRRKPGEG